MPKLQKLSQLVPNKVYSIEGLVKYKHQSQGYTTVIIQQQNTQQKIKIPYTLSSAQTQPLSLNIQQNTYYKFQNCFFNSNGWLMARKPTQSILPVLNQQALPNQITSSILNLKQIKQNFTQLVDKYFSTEVYIYAIQPKQIFYKKDGTQIPFQVVKGYTENHVVDITMWNVSQDLEWLLKKWIELSAVKIKKMTQDKFVLVSTVFTKISICQIQTHKTKFLSNKLSQYQNLSDIYSYRTIKQLSEMRIPEQKIFSTVKASIKSIVTSQYEGCSKCKRKVQGKCLYCNIEAKSVCSFGKVVLEDKENKDNNVEVIVFDEKIKGLFKYAKQNCVIQGKIKTFGRIQEDGEVVISHILTKVDSIVF